MIIQGVGNGTGLVIEQIVLQDASYRATGIFAQASFTMSAAGVATGQDTATAGPLTYSWLNGGNADDYEVFCQANSGTINGTKNSWLSLSSNRSWQLAWFSPTGRITLTIRGKSNQITVATATINFQNG
jgi:hypothetical protein